MNGIKAVLFKSLAVFLFIGFAIPMLVLERSRDDRPSVILHVMSKCPDAVLCEQLFDRVLQQIGNSSTIDFSLQYIADTANPAAIQCKHGDEECIGNKQQLCARQLFPSWFAFVLCSNTDYRNIPSNSDQCFKDTISQSPDDMTRFNDCVMTEGSQLLRDSADASKVKGISTSCSIEINNKVVCVHDGVWRDCPNGHSVQDFVQLILEKKLN